MTISTTRNKKISWAGLTLGMMMLLAPAIGSLTEEILQDTLKSGIVAVLGIVASTLSILERKKLVWHKVLWLPIALMIFAVLSATWSHSYLSSVEAIRWLVFFLILFATANTPHHILIQRIFPGIHWGATIASLWAALQFIGDFHLFTQGPNPASTFVNRNFFAEFAICALPYSIFLLAKSNQKSTIAALSIAIGINITAILMTGTRSALVSLIILALALPILFWRLNRTAKANTWNSRSIGLSIAIIFSIVAVLGSIPSGNRKIIAEFGVQNAITRAYTRTHLMGQREEYKVGTFSLRIGFWLTTLKMIVDHPISGVGAGAWEVYAPLYQEKGTQLEADFYAHNEFLQLLAEYGLVGWMFLILLIAFQWQSFTKVLKAKSEASLKLSQIRITALLSMFMLAIVSNAGFPWRLAVTGALFAISIGTLISCDAISPSVVNSYFRRIAISNTIKLIALVFAISSLLASTYLIQRAVTAENNLVRGIKLSLTISRSGNPENPFWDDAKREMLQYLHRGVSANPHYRKLTAIAADELANMGDWNNALWLWESLHASRPYVVAIIANISRAKLALNDIEGAQFYLDKGRQLQPASDAVMSLNILLLVRKEQFAEAAQAATMLFKGKVVDLDVINAAYLAAQKTENWPLAIDALKLRIKVFPSAASEDWLKIGTLYEQKIRPFDFASTRNAFAMSITTARAEDRERIRHFVPEKYKN